MSRQTGKEKGRLDECGVQYSSVRRSSSCVVAVCNSTDPARFSVPSTLFESGGSFVGQLLEFIGRSICVCIECFSTSGKSYRGENGVALANLNDDRDNVQ